MDSKLLERFAWMLLLGSLAQLAVVYLGYSFTMEGAFTGMLVWSGIIVFYMLSEGSVWILLACSIFFCFVVNVLLPGQPSDVHWFAKFAGMATNFSGAVGLLTSGVYLRAYRNHIKHKSDGV